MNARVHLIVAFLAAVAAVPLFAQQGNPSTTWPATGQTMQPVADVSSTSERVEPAHVLGTILTVDQDRLVLRVEKAVEPSAEAAAGLVGQTVDFLFDASTDKPESLMAGDRVDVWFVEEGGQRLAVRIAVAAPDDSSPGGAAHRAAAVPAGPSHPSSGPTAPATGSDVHSPARMTAKALPAAHKAVAIEDHAASPATASQPASSGVTATSVTASAAGAPPMPATDDAAASPGTAAETDAAPAVGGPSANALTPAAAPHVDDPLRFLALGGAIGLIALVMLYFTLRAHHLDLGIGSGTLGIGSGKGGVG